MTKGCKPETLNGLSGMGDLCVTCLSAHSRNYRFGHLLAQGLSSQEAKKRIGMVVEGTLSVGAALELSRKHNISVPITESIYAILNEGLQPKDAVQALLRREIKEEHL